MNDTTEPEWKRYRFQNNKVWVLMEETGQPQLDNSGQVVFAYEPNALQRYRTYPDRLQDLDAPVDVETKVSRQQSDRPRRGRRATQTPGRIIDTNEELQEVLDRETIELRPLAHIEGDETLWSVELRHGERTKSLDGKFAGRDQGLGVVQAIGEALESIKTPDRRVLVYTQVPFALGVLVQGWKAREKAQVVRQVQRSMKNFPDLYFYRGKEPAVEPSS